MKRNGSDEVDQEPSFQVLGCDHLPTYDEVSIFIIVSCIESQTDVDKEANVEEQVNCLLARRRVVNERNLHRDPQRRVQEQAHDIDVPARLVDVVRLDQAFGALLDLLAFHYLYTLVQREHGVVLVLQADCLDFFALSDVFV